jgi:hypothetical protein
LNPPTVYERLPSLGGYVPQPQEEENFQPDEALLSNEERSFLCLASRGRDSEMQALHEEARIRKLILNEALVLAARTGKVGACEYLLELGAQKLHQGYRGLTAREFAEQEGRKGVLDLLSDTSPAEQDSNSADQVELALRYALDRELYHLLTVVIPQQRSQKR